MHFHIGALHLALNQRGIDENFAAGDDRVLKLIQRGEIHHHQHIGVRDDGGTDGAVAENDAAIRRAAAHLGAVGGEPADILLLQQTLIGEELAREQDALSAEACDYNLYCAHTPASLLLSL